MVKSPKQLTDEINLNNAVKPKKESPLKRELIEHLNKIKLNRLKKETSDQKKADKKVNITEYNKQSIIKLERKKHLRDYAYPSKYIVPVDSKGTTIPLLKTKPQIEYFEKRNTEEPIARRVRVLNSQVSSQKKKNRFYHELGY